MFLAGLINLVVPLSAAYIDDEPIETNRYVYASLIGVGGGLISTGIRFIIVGAVRLGKNKKKSTKPDTDAENKEEKISD